MIAGEVAGAALHVLLLSNSQNYGQQLLEHAENWIRSVLAGKERIAIIPFARLPSDDAPAQTAQAFRRFGLDALVLDRHPSASDALDGVNAVFVVGGNTFRLLRDLYRYDFLERLRAFAAAGSPYIGASAGSNVACPTIATTNDMPVAEPPSFQALALVPFQVNTHYIGQDGPWGHMGETRLERLQDYVAENHRAVVGLPEGCALHRSPSGIELLGGGATVVRADGSSYPIAAGPLSALVLADLKSGTEPPE